MFVRVCVDVSPSGNVVGTSLEWHGESGIVERLDAHLLSLLEPFHTPWEAFALAYKQVPTQGTLEV